MELMLHSSDYAGNQATVNEILDDYMKHCRDHKNLAPKTLEGYRKIADRYLRPAFRDSFVDEITPEDVENFSRSFEELEVLIVVLYQGTPAREF